MDDGDGRREGREGGIGGCMCELEGFMGNGGSGEGVKMRVCPGTEVITKELMIVNKKQGSYTYICSFYVRFAFSLSFSITRAVIGARATHQNVPASCRRSIDTRTRELW